jgi:uncharacterized membrane-anchored protein YitT (DUF2179 family)
MSRAQARESIVPVPHTRLEDAQGLLIGTLFVGLAVVFFQKAGLLTGGTAGLSFLLHYTKGWSLGLLMFVLNLPFYVFGYRALGMAFTVKTFAAVALLSCYVEWLPHLLRIETVDPVFAAIIAGLLAGTGLLILIRHGASLGGTGILAIYLQKTRGWRAGTVQMTVDLSILGSALLLLDAKTALLSLLGAGAMNLVIAVNHRSDRYFGV